MRKTVNAVCAGILIFGSILPLQARQDGRPVVQADPIEKALASGTDSMRGKEASPTLERRDPRYHVNPGDVMDVSFNFTPEFNQSLTVQPDGFVTLQGVGDLHVAGETVPEIRTSVEKAYSRILRDPVITVTLKNFESPYFLALGQVVKPGKYDLRSDTTMAQAVAVAGGFTPQAKHSEVLLFRRVNDNWASVRKVNLKQMLKAGNLGEDLHLQPGDMVYVPQNTISKIKPFIPLPSLSYILGRYP